MKLASILLLTTAAFLSACAATPKTTEATQEKKTQVIVFNDSEVPTFQKSIKNGKITVKIVEPKASRVAEIPDSTQ